MRPRSARPMRSSSDRNQGDTGMSASSRRLAIPRHSSGRPRARNHAAVKARSRRRSQSNRKQETRTAPTASPAKLPVAEGSAEEVPAEVSSGPTKVPTLRGMSLVDAMALLTSLGIEVEDLPPQEDWSSYLVKSSKPRAGTVMDGVRRKKSVTLNLLAEVRVPRLKGLSLAAATSKLSDLGLKAVAQLESPFSFYFDLWRGEIPDASIVVGVDPPFRSILREGAKVTLRVDHPVATILKGAEGRPLDDVQSELLAQGVHVWVENLLDGGAVLRRKRWTVTGYEVHGHWDGKPEIRLTAAKHGRW